MTAVTFHCIADTNVIIYVSSLANLPFIPDNWWWDEEGLVAFMRRLYLSFTGRAFRRKPATDSDVKAATFRPLSERVAGMARNDRFG